MAIHFTAFSCSMALLLSSFAASAREMPLSCAKTSTHSTVALHIDAKSVAKSNNLRRAAGSTKIAAGTPIVVMGTILDKHCLPVKNATIQLWHADANGVALFQKNFAAMDRAFIGSGTSYTDNEGVFQFATILPGSVPNFTLPTLFIRVLHTNDVDDVYTVALPPQTEKKSPLDVYSAVADYKGMIKKEALYHVQLVVNSEDRFLKY